MQQNDLETVQDLLDIRQEVMQLRSANNAFEFSLQQKDEIISRLRNDLEEANQKLKSSDPEFDEKMISLQTDNTRLKNQLEGILVMNEELEQKCKSLAQQVAEGGAGDGERPVPVGDSEETQRLQEMVEALEAKIQTLQQSYDDVNERNKQLRQKAGQVLLQSLQS